MEAASVHAFVRFHRESTHHGAPPALAARRLSAARDEVAHARAVAGPGGGGPLRVALDTPQGVA
jgi:hypothetical protein